jgi:hypothetical protein
MAIAEVVCELSGEAEAGRAERTTNPYGLRWRRLGRRLGLKIGVPGVLENPSKGHGFDGAGSVIR